MVLSSLSDSELIRLYISQNERAFEVLLKRYKNQVYKFIYMKVKDIDLTNDIFQESFIKVVQNIKAGKYNEEGKFLPWATRIAQNLVIDYYRKQSKVRILLISCILLAARACQKELYSRTVRMTVFCWCSKWKVVFYSKKLCFDVIEKICALDALR